MSDENRTPTEKLIPAVRSPAVTPEIRAAALRASIDFNVALLAKNLVVDDEGIYFIADEFADWIATGELPAKLRRRLHENQLPARYRRGLTTFPV